MVYEPKNNRIVIVVVAKSLPPETLRNSTINLPFRVIFLLAAVPVARVMNHRSTTCIFLFVPIE